MAQAHPLTWPAGRPRTKNPIRASFNTKFIPTGKAHTESKQLSVADALNRLQGELDRLKASDYILSTNIALRLDGLPRSNQGEPEDRGVALYFSIGGKPHCLPCDRYDRVADNIAAIAKHIEATRAIERYGVANLSEMFAGFMALPAPGAQRPWREVFNFRRDARVNKEAIEMQFKILAKERHPDMRGGSASAMAELSAAREEAIKESENG